MRTVPNARKPAALLALAALAACQGRGADFSVHGTGIQVNSSAPFASQADLPARIESTVGAALRYWGGSWENLQGSTITLEGATHVECKGSSASGCYDGNIRVATSDPSLGAFACVEETALVHEVGHAVIGDPNHTDARWMDFGPVAEELDGRVGYGDTGETPCRIYVSVWRHVLNCP